MKEYLSVKERTENEYVVQRSVFIATVTPVSDAEEADRIVKEICAKYPDATHNCYAYVADDLGNVMKFSDDGEPQGTAGQPMLEVLRKQGLRHVLAVVTRYFGGVKLGAGGLVGAYTKSVTDALKKAEIVKYKPSVTFFVETDYACLKGLKREIASLSEVREYPTEFSGNVLLKFSVPTETEADVRKTISEATLGSAKVSVLDETQICYQIK